MSLQRTVRVKRGETKFKLVATLYGADKLPMKLAPVGADSWSGEVVITRKGSKTPLITGTLVIDESITGDTMGEVSYEFATDEEYIRRGEYDLEATLTDPNGRVHKFPKRAGDVFGTLIMMDSKDTTPVP